MNAAAAPAEPPESFGAVSSMIGHSPQLLERTFTTLALFTPRQPEWTMTEIARACDIAVPTVYRIVSALQRHGFLIRDDVTKRYALGPTVVRMGRTAAQRLDVRAICHPVLARAAERTHETALVTSLSDDRCSAVCLDRVESAEPLRLSVQPGREMPLHAGALQKVLLAYAPADSVDVYLARPLSRLCRSTIVEPDALREQLATIRHAGYSYSYEETNAGIWGLAVALLDPAGHARLAFGVAGPAERRPRVLGPWLDVLAKSANEIGFSLGLQPSLQAVPKTRARVGASAGTEPDPAPAAKPTRLRGRAQAARSTR